MLMIVNSPKFEVNNYTELITDFGGIIEPENILPITAQPITYYFQYLWNLRKILELSVIIHCGKTFVLFLF